MRNAEFTFDDFLDQMEQVRKMGPLDQIMEMMPGMNKMKGMKDMKVDEKQLGRVEAIVRSMTKDEKRKPEILNAQRRKRIAAGSGTTIQDVNRLIKQFDDMRKMMKQFSSMMGSKGAKGLKGKMGKGFKFPFG
jgi:signal recognition particle subunit SRP54